MMQTESQTIPCQYVSVNGIDLAYQIRGKEAWSCKDDARRPLVMLHGYSIRSTGPLYQPLYEALARDFVIYALDLRGHGGTACAVEDWTFQQLAGDVQAAVTALGLKDPIHAGHSFGGFMGLMTELLYPGTFSALCLLASSAASGGSATPEAVKSTITEEGRNAGVMEELYRKMYVRPVSKSSLAPLVQAVGLMSPRVHQAYFYDQYPTVVISEQLPSIRTPVLHINGRHDSVVSPDAQHATAMGLPNGKEVIFLDEGHMLPLEAPERTAREIASFCRHDI